MTTYYEPAAVTQRDYSDPKWASHCWSAVGSWLIRAATDGTAKVDPKDFAKSAGGGSGRTPGAGTQEDILLGLDHYGVKATIVRMNRQDATMILGSERRAVFAVATDYDQWPESESCQRTPIGPDVNHEIGIICGTPPKVMNPLCTGGDYQSIPLATVLDAAFKYARQQGHRNLIEVVRVYRQRPAQNSVADRALIADLRDQLDQWQEYASQVRQHASAILDVATPK